MDFASWSPGGAGAWRLGVRQAMATCGNLWHGTCGPARRIASWRPGVLGGWSLETGCLAGRDNLWHGTCGPIRRIASWRPGVLGGLEPGDWVSGGLWQPVATCGAGFVALLEGLHPGSLESWVPEDLEARVMRAENEDADE